MAIEQDNILIAVETVGTGKAAAELDAVSAAAGRLDVATTGMGTATERASRKQGWFLSQMLFTARRFAYGFTLAMVAAGAGLAALGLQYDNTMQQSQIAFTALLGNAQLAKNEVSSLFTLAAHTPFTFANILSTTRQLLAFGFSLKETNKMLPVLADTISAFGLTGDQISHLAIVFGQIHQSGRLLGQDMRQLQQAGVPVYGALRHQLHLTQAQILAFMKGQLMIPSSVGIPAIMNELNRRFHGMAAKQAKTFQGEFSTLKDYLSQFMGGALQGLFSGTTHFMDRINRALEGIHATMSDTGGITWKTVGYIDHLIGAGGMLVFIIQQIKTYFQNWWAFMSTAMWPALRTGAALLIGWFTLILWGINTVLGPFAHHLWLIKYALEAWVVWQVLNIGYTITAALVTMIYNGAVEFTAFVLKLARGAAELYRGTLFALMVIQALLTGETESLVALYTAAAIATWVLNFATGALAITMGILDALFLASPIGWIVLGILALTAAIYLLITNLDWVKKHWLELTIIATAFIAPLASIGLIIYKYWDNIKSAGEQFFAWMTQGWNAITGVVEGVFNTVWSIALQGWNQVIGMIRGAVDWIINGLNWVIDKINWATGAYNQVFGWATGNVPKIPHIPALAEGGTIMQGGLAFVGERGPEVMFLPQGAQVQPLSQLDRNIAGRQAGRPKLQALIPISIDGNAIAQYTADIILTTQAGMG